MYCIDCVVSSVVDSFCQMINQKPADRLWRQTNSVIEVAERRRWDIPLPFAHMWASHLADIHISLNVTKKIPRTTNKRGALTTSPSYQLLLFLFRLLLYTTTGCALSRRSDSRCWIRCGRSSDGISLNRHRRWFWRPSILHLLHQGEVESLESVEKYGGECLKF